MFKWPTVKILLELFSDGSCNSNAAFQLTKNKKTSFVLKSGYTKQKNLCSQARQFYVEALKLQKKTNRTKKLNIQSFEIGRVIC